MTTLTITNRGTRRWWALGALTLAVLAVGLDVTVLSVALPTLAGALKASEAQLQWFSAAYTLALAAAMLPAGILGDRFGRKKVLSASLILFGAGSIVCAYSPSPSVFITARIVLGIAGAGLITMALSALTVLFSEAERPKAVGVWAGANFLALPIGPILGGWLLTHYWWGWVFLLNAPVALVGLVAVLVLVPDSRSETRPGLDPLGILSSSAGLAVVTYGLIEAGQHGWSNAPALIWIASGLVILAAFGLWEAWQGRKSGGQPLVDFKLFKSASFTWGILLMTIGSLAMIGMLFTMPQYFQAVLGTDAQGSGLRLLPVIFGIVIGAVAADRVVNQIGRKLAIAIGFAIMAAGEAIAGANMTIHSGELFIAAWMTLTGLGMGMALSTAASAALVELPAEHSGVGSGIMQALQKLGAPFGVAILGSVLNAAYQGKLNLVSLPASVAALVKQSIFAGVAIAEKLNSPGLLTSIRTAFVSGMDGALWVSTGFAIAGVVLALAFMPGGAHITKKVDVMEAKQV